MGDENRDVADDFNPAVIAIFFKGFPLAEKLELNEFLFKDVAGIRAYFRIPVGPGSTGICLLKSGKFRKGIQPGILIAAKPEKLFPQRIRFASEESGGSLSKEHSSERNDRIKIDGGVREKRGILQIFRGKPALINQRLKTDQQRIPRDAGVSLVGRIAHTRRTQRQYLPELLTAFRKKVGETIGPVAQIPDAPFTGKRGGVKQNTAFAHGVSKPAASHDERRRAENRHGPEPAIRNSSLVIRNYEQPLVSPQFMHL